MLEGRVAQALATDPESLGPYRGRLEEAQQSDDPVRMAGVLADLNQDHEFRTTVGRRLLQGTW
jgi:hypothetical protein